MVSSEQALSLLAQALAGQANDASLIDGFQQEHVQAFSAVRPQTPSRISFSHSHREQRAAAREHPMHHWQAHDPANSIDALLLAAGTLAEAEKFAPPPPPRRLQQQAQAQQEAPDLDEIATQIMSAFPEFTELLQTQLQPVAPQMHEHQLDAAQQALLQQLILGVTQQQEQEDVQHEQQQRLSAVLKNHQQEGQYALQQQELACQHQHQLLQQQKQVGGLHQQPMFLMQQQQQQRESFPTDCHSMFGGLKEALEAVSHSSRQHNAAATFNLNGSGGGAPVAQPASSRPRSLLQTPWSSNRRPSPAHHTSAVAAEAGGTLAERQLLLARCQLAPHKIAAAPTAIQPAGITAMAGLDAAAAAALPVPILPIHTSEVQRQQPDNSQAQQQQHVGGDAGDQHAAASDHYDAADAGADEADLEDADVSGEDDGGDGDNRRMSRDPQQPHNHWQQQRKVDRDSDITGSSTPESSRVMQAQQQANAAPFSAPLSRRALLGIPPVGLGLKHQHRTSAHATAAAVKQPPLIKQKLPKSHHVVFVWDLDETLVLLHSLITGRYAAALEHDKVVAQQVADLGRQMQALVMKLIDNKLHFQQLENVDLVHLSDVWRLAAQYNHKKQHHKRQQPHLPKRQAGLVNGPAGSIGSERQQHDPMDVDASPAIAAAANVTNEAANAGKAESAGGAAARCSLPGDDADDVAADKAEEEAAGVDSTCCQGPQDNSRQQAAAAAPVTTERSDPPGDVVVLCDCAVAGSPSGASETELLLRPFRLGPSPEVLKNIWDDIQKVYDAGSGVLPLARPDVLAAELLWEELDAATEGWLTAAQHLLAELSSTNELLVTHVMVGNSQLVPLLGKLMLFKLDMSFGITEVYSAAAVTKLACFKRIAAKYGPRARYIVVGDGLEEEVCAERMEWPFVRVTVTPQLILQHQEAACQRTAAAAAGAVHQQVQGSSGASAVQGAVSKRPRVADIDNSGEHCFENDDHDDVGGDGRTVGQDLGRTSSPASSIQKQQQPCAQGVDSTKCVMDPGSPVPAFEAAQVGGAGTCDASLRADKMHLQAVSKPQQADKQLPAIAANPAVTRSSMPVDALGSAGHTLLELTAQQLLKLALSIT